MIIERNRDYEDPQALLDCFWKKTMKEPVPRVRVSATAARLEGNQSEGTRKEVKGIVLMTSLIDGG